MSAGFSRKIKRRAKKPADTLLGFTKDEISKFHKNCDKVLSRGPYKPMSFRELNSFDRRKRLKRATTPAEPTDEL